MPTDLQDPTPSLGRAIPVFLAAYLGTYVLFTGYDALFVGATAVTTGDMSYTNLGVGTWIAGAVCILGVRAQRWLIAAVGYFVQLGTALAIYTPGGGHVPTLTAVAVWCWTAEAAGFIAIVLTIRSARARTHHQPRVA